MPYAVRLTIFIVCACFLAAFFFCLFFYKPIKRSAARKNPAKLFYRNVAKIVRDGDYYLINELEIEDGDYFLHIDHLIGGDKYIYVITDLFCQGGISLDPHDASWLLYEKHGKRMIDNPLLLNQATVEKLSMRAGIDSSFLVGIVVVNNDCFISHYQNEGSSSLLLPLSKLAEVVESYEKRDVQPFVTSELWQIIHDMHGLYKNNEKQS